MSINISHTAFSHGLLSPKGMARTDIEAYNYGLKQAENAVVQLYGGVRKRYGTQMVESSASAGRLIPYIFSEDQAYVLKFGNGTIEVFRPGGSALGVSIASPYTAYLNSDGTLGGTATTLKFQQGMDTMIIADNTGALPLYALRRGDTEMQWSLEQVEFDPEPLAEGNFQPDATISIAATSTAHQYLATVTSSTGFVTIGGDSGRTLTASGITWKIVGVPATNEYSLEYDGQEPSALPLVSAPGTWTLGASPQTYLHMSSPTPDQASDDNIDDEMPMVGQSLSLISSGATWSASSGLSPTFSNFVASATVTTQSDNVYLITCNYSGVADMTTPWAVGATIPISGTDAQGSEHKVIKTGVWYAGQKSITDPTTITTNYNVNPEPAIMTVTSCVYQGNGGYCTFTGTQTFTWDLSDGNYNLVNAAQIGMTGGGAGVGYTTIGVASSSDADQNSAFRQEDVNAWVTYNGMQFKINNFISHDEVGVTMMGELSSPTPTPTLAVPGSWSILYPVWSQSGKWPTTVCIYQQRLVCGRQNEIWASNTGQYFSFQPGDDDTAAIDIVLDTAEANPIVNLLSQRYILAFTTGSEHIISSTNDLAFTPTNTQNKLYTEYGSAQPRALVVGNEALFVQRSGKKIRRFTYDYATDQAQAAELSVLSDELLALGTVDVAYQSEPNEQFFCVLRDGSMAVCTIDALQNVAAWTHLTTASNRRYLSVCSVPTANGDDEVWVEVYDNGYYKTERFTPDIYLDSWQYVAGPVTELTNAPVGTVSVVANGIYVGDFQSSSGTVTLPQSYSNVYYGLPITFTIETLPSDPSTQTGSSANAFQGTFLITLNVLRSQDAVVNGDEIPFRKFASSSYGEAPDIITGKVRIPATGWNEDGNATVVVQSAKPYALNILGIIVALGLNSR
jgi:hypothetical protein